MFFVLADDIEARRIFDVGDFLQSNHAMSAIQSCCGDPYPDHITQMGIGIAVDLQRKGSHTCGAKANKEASVNQKVDDIAQCLIDQSI